MTQKRRAFRWLTSLLAMLLLVPSPAHAARAASVTVSTDEAVLDFPQSIRFHVTLASPIRITSLVLEYGDTEKTCGEVVAKAYPQFKPGTRVEADWVWDMRQSGSLPPGAPLWWRWRITDETGAETVTDQKSVTWLDKAHSWQTMTKGQIRLHWYKNSAGMAQQLLDAADAGLTRTEQQTGLTNDQPVDLYIYANNDDMQDAILYEPGWTGGLAFPSLNIVIIGIAPAQLDWGRTAEVHELTHVVVGHFTFTCLGGLPTWLNEGLAVFSEGALDPESQQQFDTAVRTNELLPIRSLSGPFSEVPSRTYLSYSESFSIVSFMLEAYGREKMTALLVQLRDGNTLDEALTAVYGFNVDGLEDAWRAEIGAQPRQSSAAPTALATPTFVPTIVPVSGALPAVTPTPVNVPTLTPAQPDRVAPPLSLTLTLACTCVAMLLVLAVLVLSFVLAAGRKKEQGGSGEQHS